MPRFNGPLGSCSIKSCRAMSRRISAKVFVSRNRKAPNLSRRGATFDGRRGFQPTEDDDTGMIRRGATMEGGGHRRERNWSPIARRGFHRRSATRWFGVMADRGWKPTATFGGRSATKDKNPADSWRELRGATVMESSTGPCSSVSECRRPGSHRLRDGRAGGGDGSVNNPRLFFIRTATLKTP